jgi:hypothetical protein
MRACVHVLARSTCVRVLVLVRVRVRVCCGVRAQMCACVHVSLHDEAPTIYLSM